MTVKAILEKRGYKFPVLNSPKARAKFIGKNGYDPAILLNTARRCKDGAGPGWENAFPPKTRRGRPPKDN